MKILMTPDLILHGFPKQFLNEFYANLDICSIYIYIYWHSSKSDKWCIAVVGLLFACVFKKQGTPAEARNTII